MKNLRKALAAVLALSVISVSGSALAATGCTLTGDGATFDATYDSEANSLTAEVLTGATIGEQMTFVILDQGADEKAEIEADDILYIDQKELTAYGDSFTGVINLARVAGAVDSMPEGSYPVRLGYMTASGFKIASGDLVIENTPVGLTAEIIWGDINGDGYITPGDATEILYKTIDMPNEVTVTDKDKNTLGTVYVGQNLLGKIIWGDINGDSYITPGDATEILYKTIDMPNEVTVTDKDKNSLGTVYVGQNISFTYSE